MPIHVLYFSRAGMTGLEEPTLAEGQSCFPISFPTETKNKEGQHTTSRQACRLGQLTRNRLENRLQAPGSLRFQAAERGRAMQAPFQLDQTTPHSSKFRALLTVLNSSGLISTQEEARPARRPRQD